MADLFSELMESIDSLTDEQINQLMAKLDVKRSGSQKFGDVSEITEIPLACPHCGSISIMKHGISRSMDSGMTCRKTLHVWKCCYCPLRNTSKASVMSRLVF